MTNPSPLVLINSQSQLPNGVNVTDGSTVTIALASSNGVYSWNVECIGTDDSNSASAVNATLVINSAAQTATFTAPNTDGYGAALIFRSQVNNGIDINGLVQPYLTTTFGVYIPVVGLRLGAQNETIEGNATYGWLTKYNDAVRGGAFSGGVLSGDVTGSISNNKVNGIDGYLLPSLPVLDGYLNWTGSAWKYSTITLPTSLPPNGSAGGDLGGTYPNPTVVALQGNAIISGTLGPSQDGYVLTWKNVDSKWEPKAISSGSITLGGDVTGPTTSNNVYSIQGVVISGTPSSGQVLTATSSAAAHWANSAVSFTAGGDLSGTNISQKVVGIDGYALPSLPISDGYLNWTGSAWAYSPISIPTSLPPSGSAGGALSGSYPNPTISLTSNASITGALPIANLAHGTSAQVLMSNGTPANAWTTVSGDVSITSSGVTKVIGVDGYSISGNPTSGQVLEYNGTNLVWATPSFGVTWANDLAGSTGTNQYVAAISGNAGAGGTIPINANVLQFGATQTNPSITQTGNNGNNFAIFGQNNSSGIGGSVQIYSGIGSTYGGSLTLNDQYGVVSLGLSPSWNYGAGLIELSTTRAGGNIQIVTEGSGGGILISSTGTLTLTGSLIATNLGGSGSGYVAVDNIGNLSFSAGTTPSGTAGGDLGGTYPNPTVASLTGNSGTVSSAAHQITFNNNLIGGIALDVASMASTSSGSGSGGQDIYLIGQPGQNATGASHNGGNGGNAHITSGIGGTSGSASPGTSGSVILSIGGSSASGSGTPGLTLNPTGVVTIANLGVGLVHADSSGNLTSSTLVNADVSATAAVAVSKLAAGTANQVLINNATPSPAWTTLSGDVTNSLGAMSVGGIQGKSLPTLPVSDGYLNYTGSAWQYSAITIPTSLPPNGSAGGDLSGTYPNPTISGLAVSKLASGTANQVLINSATPTPAWTTLSGDVTNSLGVMTTVGIRGKTLASSLASVGASQDGYVLTWVNASSDWEAKAQTGGGGGSGITALTGDVTASGTGSVAATVAAISGSTPIVITPAELQFKNSTSTPLIDQAALASTSSGSGSAGQNMSITAQAGQAATGGSHNGGNGGNLILSPGAGGTSGSATAGVQGSIVFNGGCVEQVSSLKTGNYTATVGDYIIGIGTLTGSITITLPSSPVTGQTYIIKDVNGTCSLTNTITITPASGNIDGNTTSVIATPYDSISIVYSGAQWSII